MTKPTTSRRYLTLADVEERYAGAWSRWQLYELARTSRIPHRRPAGTRRLLFLESDLDAWDDGAPLDVRRLPRGGRVVLPTSKAA